MSSRARLEQLTHRFPIRRRLPAPFRDVRFLASSEGGLKFLKPSLANLDPTLLGLAVELVNPGDVVWDIGANMGIFTFAAARKAGTRGRVVAVEADTYNATLLRRSASLQGAASAPVDVVDTAISDHVGLAAFQIARRNRATNALSGYGSSEMGGVRQVQTVTTVTLDALLDHFPAPTVLKIDVEGAEVLALSGAAAALRAKPRIVCEVTATNAAAVAALLRPLGYAFFDGDQSPPREECLTPAFTLVAISS